MFRFLTAGESHGKGLVVIIEGIPAGLSLDDEYIARELARRQKSYGRSARMEIEQDHADIVSGVRHGLTIGSPISLFIPNRDWENWKEIMAISLPEARVEPVTRPRPGHADLPGVIKYHLDDIRPIMERASARETAARVAVGAIAKRLLEEFGIELHSHTICIGGCWAQSTAPVDWAKVEASPVSCADSEAEQAMMKAIDEAKQAGDTVGDVLRS